MQLVFLSNAKRQSTMFRLVILTCFLAGALSRTVPETQKCKRVLSLNNECTKYISTNFKVHLIFEPLRHNEDLFREICRVYDEYHKCLTQDLPWIQQNCPRETTKYAESLIRLFKPVCQTYTTDRLSMEDLGIMPCVRTNTDVQSELKECVKDLYQKIIWNGKIIINDCSFVDEIKKCTKPLEMCGKPRHVERLREYIDEIKSDVCTLTQGVVSRIQETMNVDTLGVNSFSYRY